MNTKPFIYGMSVEGDNFTDREFETKRLKLNFENGINSILISPRRMGKTSLVKKVKNLIDDPKIKVVYIDIYKCRTEFDFYEKFASSILKQTATKIDRMIEDAKEFITNIAPKITYSPEPNTDFSISLGINKQNNTAEDILDLPEKIAIKRGISIVVCIDEFQQIGEMPDSLTVQRTIRSAWQHHQHVSYCLLGSKQHLMANLFYSRKMPFYQFGDMFFLKRIPTEKWVPFIIKRFELSGKEISSEIATAICTTVDNYSAYVQQLAWNVMALSDEKVTDDSFHEGVEATLAQVIPLFIEQTANLTTYQLNFLRALCSGYNTDFGRKEITSLYDLGSRSNLPKIKKALVDKEMIETSEKGIYIADPLFKLWFSREMM